MAGTTHHVLKKDNSICQTSKKDQENEIHRNKIYFKIKNDCLKIQLKIRITHVPKFLKRLIKHS